MHSHESLYRVSVNSSGLIFAVVVGLWAAYLVPMWLRRQDELNEARPTERFTTAIRLLAGRAALERRAERELRRGGDPDAQPDGAPGGDADVRGFAEPVTTVEPAPAPPAPAPASKPPGTTRDVRAKVLARRRRTITLLFLAFTLGGVFTAAAGRTFLWVPAVPAFLLSSYIVHLRRQERRRYAVAMDRRRAEDAARRLRARPRPQPAAPAPEPVPEPGAAEKPAVRAAEDRRALVEQTDHAEWVDQQRRRGTSPDPEGWEPAPVPLPTYVNAPVAPRRNRAVDLDAPDTWSAARSTTAATAPTPPPATRGPERTPLFDQYADDDRPRAAGE